MLQIQSFTFNPFQENTYLLINEQKECLIIDPGMFQASECQKLSNFISENLLIPLKIINTHAHIDHILGINYLKEVYQIPFGMHKNEDPILANALTSAMMFGIPLSSTPEVDFYIPENSIISFGEEELEVRLVPGHSPGSIVFYNAKNNFAISGDTLFQGSIGRTDLPGGNHEQLLKSIQEQLYTLPDSTVIHSGHGPSTTIGNEKRSNPFVRA